MPPTVRPDPPATDAQVLRAHAARLRALDLQDEHQVRAELRSLDVDLERIVRSRRNESGGVGR